MALSLIFEYTESYFEKSVAKYSIPIINSSWPFFMIIYVAFTYFDGYWKHTFVVCFVATLVISVGLLICKLLKFNDFDKG